MIKKFFSNALLSVVMDKKARDKINALQDSKSQPAPAETEAASDMDIPRFLPDKGDQPKAAKHNRPPHIPPHRPPAVEEEDPGLLIREALETAERELAQKLNPTHKGKPVTPERQALIDQAMAIHQSKSHILDDLDQDQRDKLYVMAMQALNEQIKS